MPWIRSTAHASSRRNTTVVGMSPYFENSDGEKIEKYSHEIEGKKIQFEKQKKF